MPTASGVFKVQAEARREGLAIRQLHLRVAGKHGFSIVGMPTQVAGQLQHGFRSEAADGVDFVPTFFANGLHDFVDLVIPELRRRDLFRTEYGGSTVRAHLGAVQRVRVSA